MPSRIETSAGALAGTRDGDVSSFKGIPFAAPPVGDLRWRPPQPAPRWSGVRDATAYGSACMQKPGISLENGGDPSPLSEDCLYLNVWTPSRARRASAGDGLDPRRCADLRRRQPAALRR